LRSLLKMGLALSRLDLGRREKVTRYEVLLEEHSASSVDAVANARNESWASRGRPDWVSTRPLHTADPKRMNWISNGKRTCGQQSTLTESRQTAK